MKLKSQQQELERLVEEQEALAVMEEEAQQIFSPYRVNEDLSSRLDLPRDVKGLSALVEKKAMLLDSKKELNASSILILPLEETMGYYVSMFIGAIPGMAIAIHSFNSPPPTEWILRYVGGILLAVGGAVGGAFISEKISKNRHQPSQKYKDFEQEKAAKINALDEQIKTIKQKLSFYQTDCRKGDLVLAEEEKKVFIGDVYAELDGKAILRRYSLSNPKRLVNVNTAVCVLTPAAELSIDDLCSLDPKIPIVYNEGEQEQQEYGFVEKREKDFLIRNSPGMEIKKAYPLHLLGSIMINPRILVPELTSSQT